MYIYSKMCIAQISFTAWQAHVLIPAPVIEHTRDLCSVCALWAPVCRSYGTPWPLAVRHQTITMQVCMAMVTEGRRCVIRDTLTADIFALRLGHCCKLLIWCFVC